MTTYRITDRESHLFRTATDYNVRDELLDMFLDDHEENDPLPVDVRRAIDDLADAISRGDWQAVYGAADYLDLDVDVEAAGR